MLIDELTYETRVLVVIVPRVADLEIARERRWYRVPLRHAPRIAGAEALAFYLPGVFGDERWAVRYVADVLRVRVAARRELLPEEPQHRRADERYLCFELGTIERLPVAVPSSRLRRITFIPTTLGQILRARDVRELWQPEENQQVLASVWGAGLAGKTIKR